MLMKKTALRIFGKPLFLGFILVTSVQSFAHESENIEKGLIQTKTTEMKITPQRKLVYTYKFYEEYTKIIEKIFLGDVLISERQDVEPQNNLCETVLTEQLEKIRHDGF